MHATVSGAHIVRNINWLNLDIGGRFVRVGWNKSARNRKQASWSHTVHDSLPMVWNRTCGKSVTPSALRVWGWKKKLKEPFNENRETPFRLAIISEGHQVNQGEQKFNRRVVS